MTKTRKIIFTIAGVVILVQVVLLVLSVGFGFKECRAGQTPEQAILCGQTNWLLPFENIFFTLPIDKVAQEADEMYITFRYPLFWGISFPMRFRAGVQIPTQQHLAQNIFYCDLRKDLGKTGSCQLIPSSRLNSFVQPYQILGAGVIHVTESSPFLEKDLNLKRCAKENKDFIAKIQSNKGFLSYLPFFKRSNCAPTVMVIFRE